MISELTLDFGVPPWIEGREGQSSSRFELILFNLLLLQPCNVELRADINLNLTFKS